MEGNDSDVTAQLNLEGEGKMAGLFFFLRKKVFFSGRDKMDWDIPRYPLRLIEIFRVWEDWRDSSFVSAGSHEI